MSGNSDNCCRICLLSDVTKLVNIFNDNIDSLYSSITQLSITRDDVYPKLICYKCVDELMNWEEFKKKCEDSLNTFLQEKNSHGGASTSQAVMHEKRNSNVVENGFSINQVHEKFKFKAQPKQEPAPTRINPWTVGHSCELCFEPFDRFEFFKTKPHPIINLLKKPKPFRCHKCHKNYSTRERLLEHERKHHQKSLLVERRPKPPTNPSAAANHPINSKSDDVIIAKEWFQCDICPFKYDNMRALKVHKSFHRRRGECGEETIIETPTPSKNVSIEVGEKLWNCKKCSKRFFTQHGLLIHVKRAHKRKRKYSTDPMYGSTNNANTSTPSERPNPYLPVFDSNGIQELFTCEKCSKQFTTRHGLSMHKKYHKNHPDPSDIIDLESSSRTPMSQNHSSIQDVILERTTEGINQQELICDVCFKKFDSLRGLKVHKHFHTRNGELMLANAAIPEPVAPEQRPVNLDPDTETVSDVIDVEEQFPCDTCKKEFASRRLLSIHKFRVHEIPSLISNNTNDDDADELMDIENGLV